MATEGNYRMMFQLQSDEAVCQRLSCSSNYLSKMRVHKKSTMTLTDKGTWHCNKERCGHDLNRNILSEPLVTSDSDTKEVKAFTQKVKGDRQKVASVVLNNPQPYTEVVKTLGLSESDWLVHHFEYAKAANGESYRYKLQASRKLKSKEFFTPITYATPKVSSPKVSAIKSEIETTLVLPDSQHGFALVNDELVPFHDPRTLDLVLQIAADLQPNRIILLGDMIDFAEFSRFFTEPSHIGHTQKTFEALSEWLYQLADVSPGAQKIYLEGNHEKRFRKTLIEKGLGILTQLSKSKLKQQTDRDELIPLCSIRHYLGLDSMPNGGWTYIEDYPQGEYWINSQLQVLHGEYLNLKKAVENKAYSVIMGHLHKRHTHADIVHTHYGSYTRYSVCPGCLCRTDYPLPGVATKHNYQQGFSVVNSKEDGWHQINSYSIDDHQVVFRDKLYTA